MTSNCIVFLFADPPEKNLRNHLQLCKISFTSPFLISSPTIFCISFIFGPWAFRNWPIITGVALFGCWLTIFTFGVISMIFFYKEKQIFFRYYYDKNAHVIIKEKCLKYGSVLKGLSVAVQDSESFHISQAHPKLIRSIKISDLTDRSEGAKREFETRFLFDGLPSKPSTKVIGTPTPKITNRSLALLMSLEFGGFHFLDFDHSTKFIKINSFRNLEKSFYQSGWWDEISLTGERIDPFEILPLEVIIEILSCIVKLFSIKPDENWRDNLSELGRIANVSRSWNHIANNEIFWKRILKFFKPLRTPFETFPSDKKIILKEIGYFSEENTSLHYILYN